MNRELRIIAGYGTISVYVIGKRASADLTLMDAESVASFGLTSIGRLKARYA